MQREITFEIKGTTEEVFLNFSKAVVRESETTVLLVSKKFLDFLIQRTCNGNEEKNSFLERFTVDKETVISMEFCINGNTTLKIERIDISNECSVLTFLELISPNAIYHYLQPDSFEHIIDTAKIGGFAFETMLVENN